MVGGCLGRLILPTGIVSVTVRMDIHKAGAYPHSPRIQDFRIRGDLQVCTDCPDHSVLQKQCRILQNTAGRDRFCMDDGFHKDILQFFNFKKLFVGA